MPSVFRFTSSIKILLALVVSATLGLTLFFWLSIKKFEQQNRINILIGLKLANKELLSDIERQIKSNEALNPLSINTPDVLFSLPVNQNNISIYSISDSTIFESTLLIQNNGKFYAKGYINISNTSIEFWYPIDKTIKYYNLISGERVALKHSSPSKSINRIVQSEIFIANIKNINSTETELKLVAGNSSSLAMTMYVVMAILGLAGLAIAIILFNFYKKYQTIGQQSSPVKFENQASTDLLNQINLIPALDNANIGIRVISTDFKVLLKNKKFQELTQHQQHLQKEEFCYENFGSIYCHTADCPLVSISNGCNEILREETRYLSNGQKVIVEVHAYPLNDSSGKTLAIAEEIKDITDQHLAEETLRQTENQFTVFIDSLPLGIYIEDGLTHELIFQNHLLKKILHGKTIKELVTSSKTEQGAYIAQEEEVELPDNDGTLRYFIHHRFKFIGVNNRLKIGGILIDITRKKEVEHYRDVLSKAIEFTPVSVVILSPYFEFELINPNFTELTGYTIEQLYSKNILELNLEPVSENVIEKALEQVKAGKTWQGELQLLGRDRNKLWVSASFSPVINGNNTLQHILMVLEDITRRKEYERELILAKAKAEESDKLKTNFLNNISHEIRTPLNAIIGYTSLLSDNTIGPEERNGFYETIYTNSNELLRIIENLLEISQIEAGHITIKKSEFSVNALLNEIYLEFDEVEKGSSRIKLSLRKEIYEDDLVVLSDPIRLKQVIKHLLSNAYKFTPKGFVEFGYRLKDENNLLFYVVDSGIGIEPDKLPYLFNPFRQADDSSTRKHGGLGLGLAISKHIVEKLGGKIWMNSTPGSGTSVFFSIPFVPVTLKFDNTTVGNGIKEYNWHGKTILIADDIDANFIFLKAALQKTKAKLLWARNGHEALEYFKKGEKINLVLMDLVMPKMDGFEATRLIKSIDSKIPVVGQTAYPEQASHARLIACGIDTVLEKPIRTQHMLAEISRFFEN